MGTVTMRDRVRTFAEEKGVFSTVDLFNFQKEVERRSPAIKGLLTIQRTARRLCHDERVLRRYTREEKILKGLNPKLAIYEWIGGNV